MLEIIGDSQFILCQSVLALARQRKHKREEVRIQLSFFEDPVQLKRKVTKKEKKY